MQVFKSKAFKRVMSVLVLILITVALYRLATDNLKGVTYYDFLNYDLEKIREKDEEIDLVFLGASRTFMSMVPSVLEEKISAENVVVFSTAMQPFCGSYYYLKDIIKYYDPKKVVIDVSWDRLINEKEPQACLLIYDRLKGLNKLEFALKCFSNEDKCFLLGPTRYKTNIRKLESIRDDKRVLREYKEGVLDESTVEGDIYREKGFVYTHGSYTTGSITYPSGENYEYSIDSINDENIKYLDKCVELCKKNDIEVELLVAPCAMTYIYYVSGYDDAIKFYKDYAKEKDISFVNLNYLKGREEFLPDELMRDMTHTSGDGAYVISEKYGDILLKESNGEDISDLFYKDIDELKSDVHRIVALDTTVDTLRVNDDGSVDTVFHIDSLQNDDITPFYQIECTDYADEKTIVLQKWTDEENISITLPKESGFCVTVRAKSQNEGDKEAVMKYYY